LLERSKSGERVVLIHIYKGRDRHLTNNEELYQLAISAGAEVVGEVFIHLRSLNPRYLIGKGKIQELRQKIQDTQAEIIISSAPLNSSQERNLERELKCRMLDRNELILDIFSQRARSFEGKLQVELAQLRHLSTRLVRGWTHLERQKGGIGLRGPGEKQLETDRRLVNNRIKQLKQQLRQVDKRRSMSRMNRIRSETSTVAIVGYTNAGKSTLFNKLTRANAVTADQLFATLDTTMRRLKTKKNNTIIFADTVGFINDLPHELIAAFRSTLEEIKYSELILHIIDASDKDYWQHLRYVNSVLRLLDADKIPQIRVYNKIDKINRNFGLAKNSNGQTRAAWISAFQPDDIRLLTEAIQHKLQRRLFNGTINLKQSQGRQRAHLFDLGAVVSENILTDGSWLLEIKMNKNEFRRFVRKEKIDEDTIKQASLLMAS
tara:strand:+ start:1005 stop:2306 length:1302 start_codon:yes stop_codon:yes gene_type:complete